MLIYTGDSGDMSKIIRMRALGMGVMLSPSAMNFGQLSLPKALDNGAFSSYTNGYGFNEYGFLKVINKCIKERIKLDFIACPDIVAGGIESLNFSMMWKDRLPNWDLYLVVQDEMEVLDVSGLEHHFKGIFVGGSKEWKWETAHEWSQFCKDNNLKFHIGRCGTVKNLLYAYELGADSVDSTNFTRNNAYHVVEEYLKMRGLTLNFAQEKP